MKSIFGKFILLLIIYFMVASLGCERELKEHPMPASLKRRLEMKNDPDIQRKKISGTITIATLAKAKQPDQSTLFIFALHFLTILDIFLILFLNSLLSKPYIVPSSFTPK